MRIEANIGTLDAPVGNVKKPVIERIGALFTKKLHSSPEMKQKLKFRTQFGRGLILPVGHGKSGSCQYVWSPASFRIQEFVLDHQRGKTKQVFSVPVDEFGQTSFYMPVQCTTEKRVFLYESGQIVLIIGKQEQEAEIGPVSPRGKVESRPKSYLNTIGGLSFGEAFRKILRPGQSNIRKKKDQHQNPQLARSPHKPLGITV